MTFDSDRRQDPFSPPLAEAVHDKTAGRSGRRQSGLGIASFVLAMTVGVLAFALVLLAGVMEISTPGGVDEESAVAIVVGLSLFAIFGLNILGIGLAIAGLIQADRLRTFALLGLVFNLLIAASLGGLVIIGLAMA